MDVLTWEFWGEDRSYEMRLVPLGDVHMGNAACDEKRLREIVKRIKEDENCYWIGMGDACEFIQLSDPRFDVESVGDWVRVEHLGDIVSAQKERFLAFVAPIASRCLGLVEGNHEQVIKKHYERDIYREIVHGVKQLGGFQQDTRLGLGVSGWIRLRFYRSKAKKKHRVTTVDINVHHGFVGGRLAGAKALNMQRWLWSHKAHLVIFGHSHNTGVQIEAVERLDRSGNIIYEPRIGCYSGTFLGSGVSGKTTYQQRKGYLPLPQGGVQIHIRPFVEGWERKIVVEAFA